MSDDERPATVVEAIAAVQRELPGIGKDNHSEQGYNYRGIEAITRHAQALFGKYRIVPVPRVVDRKTVELTINNRPWTQEELAVVYRVYGPSHGKLRARKTPEGEVEEQVEDWIDVGPIWGLGRDNSDKGANKAITQSFKYGLIQMLVVGDGKDDPDREIAHEADARQQTAPADAHKQEREEAAIRFRALSPADRELVRAFMDDRKIPRVPARWDDEQLELVLEEMDRVALLLGRPFDDDEKGGSTSSIHASASSEATDGAGELNQLPGTTEPAGAA